MICCGKMFPTKYYLTNTLMVLVVMLIMFGKTDNQSFDEHGKGFTVECLLVPGRQTLRLYELTFILIHVANRGNRPFI